MKRWLCVCVLGMMCWSCSSPSVEATPQGTLCPGKCDVPGAISLETLSAIPLDELISCTVTPGLEEDSDTIACRAGVLEADTVSLSHVVLEILTPDPHTYLHHAFDKAQLSSLQEVEVGALPQDSYPLKFRAQVRWGGQGLNLSGLIDAPKVFGANSSQDLLSTLDERPTSQVRVTMNAGFEIWPVVLWPSKALEEAWRDGHHDLWIASANQSLELPRVQAYTNSQSSFFISYQFSLAAMRTKHETLSPLSRLPLFFPTTPNAPTPRISFGLDGALDQTNVEIDAPGYYLLHPDGTATRVTLQELAAEGAFPTTSPSIDPEPLDPNTPGEEEDPCNGACQTEEACVHAACVPRADQVQSEACTAPESVCDPGEDRDCAQDHACVQEQCRRLSCQQQPTSCSPPTQPCDAGEDTDCVAGHTCEQGLCLRVICQP